MRRERWKPVVGFEKWYLVSDEGRIQSIGNGQGRRTDRLLKQWETPYGYMQIQLQVDNKTRNVLAHTLVAEAFLGPCPEGLEIDHKDGNKSNNVVANLHYVTRSVNMLLRNARRRALGLPLTSLQHGAHNPMAKLTWDDAVEIRRLGAEGVIQREIAARFGVKREAIGKILRNERWAK